MSSKTGISQNDIHLNRDSSANIIGVTFPIRRKKAASTLRNYGVGNHKRTINAQQFVISESPENASEFKMKESMKKKKEAAFIASHPY